MPTDLPRVFAEEHDYSAVEAYHHSVRVKSNARLALACGLAALAAGVGIGAGAVGLSYLLEPKIVETTRVVTETKVERVEVPKIIEHEKVVTVDRPVVVEKPTVSLPPPAQSPVERFTQSEEYRTAEFNGRILKFHGGVIQFDNGRDLMMANGNGSLNLNAGTTRYDGDLAYCHHDGNFANGRQRWPCKVMHNGVVEELKWAETKPAPHPADDPLNDLFN